MKRIQVIETGILIVALIFGYKFAEGIFSALVQLFYGFGVGGFDMFEALLPTVLISVVYAIFFVILIRRSGRLAVYLTKNMTGEMLSLKIGKKALLHVILIGICLGTILSNIAEILLYIFETFKHEVGRSNFTEDSGNKVSGYVFKLAAIKTIVAIVIIYFAKDICNWFVKKKEADELTFSSPENNE